MGTAAAVFETTTAAVVVYRARLSEFGVYGFRVAGGF